MERAAERSPAPPCRRTSSAPRPCSRRRPAAPPWPGPRPWRWRGTPRRRPRWRRRARRSRTPSRSAIAAARRAHVDQLHLAARNASREPGHQAPDGAAADDRDAAARDERRVPHGVDRGLEVGGQDRASRRHALGHQMRRRGRDHVARLVRIEREHGAADQCRMARARRRRRWRSRTSPGRGSRRPETAPASAGILRPARVRGTPAIRSRGSRRCTASARRRRRAVGGASVSRRISPRPGAAIQKA